MRKFLKIFSVLIFCLALFSCSKENDMGQINEVESNENSQFTSKEDRLKFFGEVNEPHIGGPATNYSVTVESDLVNSDKGCHTVNVRIYYSLDGNTFLVANQNVLVGEEGAPCNTTDSEDMPESEECETGYIRDTNDFVLYPELENEYCLLDLLIEYDEIFEKYLESRDELLQNL